MDIHGLWGTSLSGKCSKETLLSIWKSPSLFLIPVIIKFEIITGSFSFIRNTVFRDVTGQEKVSKKIVGQEKSGKTLAKSVKFSILTEMY